MPRTPGTWDKWDTGQLRPPGYHSLLAHVIKLAVHDAALPDNARLPANEWPKEESPRAARRYLLSPDCYDTVRAIRIPAHTFYPHLLVAAPDTPQHASYRAVLQTVADSFDHEPRAA